VSRVLLSLARRGPSNLRKDCSERTGIEEGLTLNYGDPADPSTTPNVHPTNPKLMPRTPTAAQPTPKPKKGSDQRMSREHFADLAEGENPGKKIR